ncbi:MAG TPA: ABC transporter ATP-binding protein [Cytophagaceae bacterium]|jgi:lipopolysaccharide transport system ATP-binding protein|nr:ABC transporter ATP-binding protein [Cytophagaceae bacterium]
MNSSQPVIKVEQLSKLYKLGQLSTGSISHDLNRWWAGIRGKEDPYLRIGESNDRQVKGNSDYVWALKDIDFEVQQGEILGIIGRNGAGKSTLLKLLSRTTSPTKGSIKVKGRIASLLEVGTGFHPELTGCENIYLNGAILGMTKQEIKRKFDEIVEFAGVERYIDTPVKRYSSGMYVRLAFAVAAHLESEILVIDEVLAVGDADFQKKCLGKMGDVAKGGEKTILFVSHDLAAVAKLCQRGILMDQGKIKAQGSIDHVLNEYLLSDSKSKTEFIFEQTDSVRLQEAYLIKAQVLDLNDYPIKEVKLGQAWKLKVFLQVNQPMQNFIVGVGFETNLGMPIRTVWCPRTVVETGEYCVTFTESDILFSSGEYKVTIGITNNERTIQYSDEDVVLRISEIGELVNDGALIKTKGAGVILNKGNIAIRRV